MNLLEIIPKRTKIFKKLLLINFIGSLNRTGSTTMFFILLGSIRNHFEFFKRNCKNIVTVFYDLQI